MHADTLNDCAAPSGAVEAFDPCRQAVTVLDSLRKHIALLDPQGTIVTVNRAWKEFGLANGIAPEQSGGVGINYLQVCGPAATSGEDALAALAAGQGLSEVLAGRLPFFELEYPCHAPHEQRWYLMRASPMLDGLGGAVVTHEDITHRWQLEQQRSALIAELQAANRELSEFAYVVSHDLKAPLRGISSLASWLLSDHADKLGDEGRRLVELMAGRVKRLAAQIDAILAYSRAGRSLDDRGPVPVGPLLRITLDLLAPPPHIRIDIDEPLPVLHIEAVKIQQVLQNLLSNAIDFIDKPQGHICVSAQRDGAFWQFTVSDNGPGIDTRHHQRIFQLFQTLVPRDERERTGVGLALVKKIVELEGGRVWVESSVGAGSRFHFTLPAHTEHP